MLNTTFKFFFIHVPKCGGTSIHEAFSQDGRGHVSAHTYKKQFPYEWSKYKKFTIVRNPAELAWSSYDFWRTFSSRPFRVRTDPFNHFAVRKAVEDRFNAEVGSFDEYLEKLPLLSAMRFSAIPHHFESQHPMIFDEDENPMVDKIIKLEDIDAEWPGLMSWLRTDGIQLPHVNAQYTETPKFTNKQLKRIHELFAKDYELLGYEMEEMDE